MHPTVVCEIQPDFILEDLKEAVSMHVEKYVSFLFRPTGISSQKGQALGPMQYINLSCKQVPAGSLFCGNEDNFLSPGKL